MCTSQKKLHSVDVSASANQARLCCAAYRLGHERDLQRVFAGIPTILSSVRGIIKRRPQRLVQAPRPKGRNASTSDVCM